MNGIVNNKKYRSSWDLIDKYPMLGIAKPVAKATVASPKPLLDKRIGGAE